MWSGRSGVWSNAALISICVCVKCLVVLTSLSSALQLFEVVLESRRVAQP